MQPWAVSLSWEGDRRDWLHGKDNKKHGWISVQLLLTPQTRDAPVGCANPPCFDFTDALPCPRHAGGQRTELPAPGVLPAAAGATYPSPPPPAALRSGRLKFAMNVPLFTSLFIAPHIFLGPKCFCSR